MCVCAGVFPFTARSLTAVLGPEHWWSLASVSPPGALSVPSGVGRPRVTQASGRTTASGFPCGGGPWTVKALERGASRAGPGQKSALLEARADPSGCPARGAGKRGLKHKSRFPWEGIGPRSRLPPGPHDCHNVRERGWTVSPSRGQRPAPGCSEQLLDGLPTPRRAISHPGPLRPCRVPRAGGHCPPGAARTCH